MIIWLVVEAGMRIYLEAPLESGFYGSIPRHSVSQMQKQYGVQVTSGKGWTHLGWIADPEKESYRIVRVADDQPIEIGRTTFGSYLWGGESGTYQVWAKPANNSQAWLVGEVEVIANSESSPIYVPHIAGDWQELFRPQIYGFYINDHTVFQDAEGSWRLVGITSLSNGDYNVERYFAVGVSQVFPPPDGMDEQEPLASFDELAWAPHVIQAENTYHMFWSPHELHQMTSEDGISWENHRVTMSAPMHKFFRDPMVIQVAPGQWLLFTIARGAYFSQVDVYQSFDLEGWQYIRTALRSSWGSERNSPFASMESPFVIEFQDHYYLSLTYNNDSFFWPGILMLFKIWPDRASYNQTLVFHSDNPYDFGTYSGTENSPSLLTQLETHAPEIIHDSEEDKWYLTTAGWPWVATLTTGEVAIAPLVWEPGQ